ncbi:MAG: hypothetical protein IK130_09610 [Oscillospiraceae bacterium]|nr:hypothetical protein [Oscillospiraceae bacterium]
MAKKRSAKSVIGLVIGGGIAILILYGVACLYLDEIRAKMNAADLYPNEEILDVQTNNRIFTGDAAVMLYNAKEQFVFEQDFKREWIFFNEVEMSDHGYSQTNRMRRELNQALEKFESRVQTEHVCRYYPDGNGVMILTAENDIETLEEMYNCMFEEAGQLQQRFSIVCCLPDEYAEVAKHDNDELIRAYAKLDWFDGKKTIVPSVHFLPQIMRISEPYAEFSWQSRDIDIAIQNRENDNDEGVMLKYADFDVAAPVELYYEYSEEVGEMRGVRQWAHSSTGSDTSYHFN